MSIKQLQIRGESTISATDALSKGIKTVLAGLGHARDRHVLVESVQLQSEQPGWYCVSMRISVDAPR